MLNNRAVKKMGLLVQKVLAYSNTGGVRWSCRRWRWWWTDNV